MEKQRWEEPEKRRGEKRREEKRREEKRREERRSQKKGVRKKNAGARKGRKVVIHCVFSNDLWLRRVEK
jgi:hypothetical protein